MIVTDAQQAYDQIKERIITTRMPPGMVIQIQDLMAEICLGRTPIREALKLLEVEQLVTVSPRRGMFVTDVSVTDLLQVHEIRMDLEALCVSLAVTRIMPNELAQLRCLVQELDAAEQDGDQMSLLQLDRNFHALLAKASHNRILQTETERLYNLSLRIWYLCVNQLRSTDLAEDAFREILAACETQDRPRAEKAIRRHILMFYESIKEAL
jgi:GntR family transcriptional regulator, rspAB operon transcriptional repressor